jgi:hypothetical protein
MRLHTLLAFANRNKFFLLGGFLLGVITGFLGSWLVDRATNSSEPAEALLPQSPNLTKLEINDKQNI